MDTSYIFFFSLPPLLLFPLNVSHFGHKKAEEIILKREGIVFKVSFLATTQISPASQVSFFFKSLI